LLRTLFAFTGKFCRKRIRIKFHLKQKQFIPDNFQKNKRLQAQKSIFFDSVFELCKLCRELQNNALRENETLTLFLASS